MRKGGGNPLKLSFGFRVGEPKHKVLTALYAPLHRPTKGRGKTGNSICSCTYRVVLSAIAITYLHNMRVSFLVLFLVFGFNGFAQSIPPDVAGALNALKVKKAVYKEVKELSLNKAPEHIRTTGIKMFTDTLMLFSFARQEVIGTGIGKPDNSLMQRNKSYQYYAFGRHGNTRGFYYRGKFNLLDRHAPNPDIDSSNRNAGLVYPDTSIMIVTRLHRYLITEWKPYDMEDSSNYHNLHIIFIFDKSGKLINHFSYDNYRLPVLTSVGFFNKDDLLDVAFYDKTETVNGQTDWHFKLYSLDKKGRTRESKFNKAGHSVIIPTTN